MKAALSKIISSLRPNILLLATFVFVVVIALVVTLFNLATGNSNDAFLKGALVGLIGAGITALTSLGNNILEKDSSQENDRIAQTPPTQE